MPRLQDLYDSFSPSEQAEIIGAAGLGDKIITVRVDVRIAPEAIFTAILRIRTISNEEFAAIVREYKIPIWKPSLANQASVSLSFGGEGPLALNHVTAASMILCEVSQRIASVLAELDTNNVMPNPPSVAKIFVSSTGIELIGNPELVTALHFVFQVVSHLTLGTVAVVRGPEILKGAAEFIDKIIAWRKAPYELEKLKLEGELKRLEIEEKRRTIAEIKPPAVADTAPVSASSPTIVQNFNFYLTDANAPHPAFAAQVLHEALPAAIRLLEAGGSPRIVVMQGSEQGNRGIGANAG